MKLPPRRMVITLECSMTKCDKPVGVVICVLYYVTTMTSGGRVTSSVKM